MLASSCARGRSTLDQGADGGPPSDSRTAEVLTWFCPSSLDSAANILPPSPHPDEGSFTVHPTRTNTVFAATLLMGVVRSTDGGRTWCRLGAEMGPGTVRFSPAETDLAYALVSGALYVSRDGGETFERIALTTPDGAVEGVERGLRSLLVSPTGALFALGGSSASSYQPTHLFDSKNGGVTWTQVMALPEAWNIRLLAIDEHERAWIAVAALDPETRLSEFILYRSRPDRSGWDLMTRQWVREGGSPALVHPSPGVYLVKTGDSAMHAMAFRSTDDGATWSRVEFPSSPWTSVPALAQDVRGDVYAVVMANSSQLFRSEDGFEWSEVAVLDLGDERAGASPISGYDMAVSRADGDDEPAVYISNVAGHTRIQGSERTQLETSTMWSRRASWGAQGKVHLVFEYGVLSASAGSPPEVRGLLSLGPTLGHLTTFLAAHPDLVDTTFEWRGLNQGLAKRTPAGDTVMPVEFSSPEVSASPEIVSLSVLVEHASNAPVVRWKTNPAALAFSSGPDRRMVASTFQINRVSWLIASDDAGVSWKALATVRLAPGGFPWRALTVGARAIYAATSDGVVLSSLDGSAWSSTPFRSPYAQAITVDPRDDAHAVVVGSGGIWETRDAGKSWTQALEDGDVPRAPTQPPPPRILSFADAVFDTRSDRLIVVGYEALERPAGETRFREWRRPDFAKQTRFLRQLPDGSFILVGNGVWRFAEQ